MKTALDPDDTTIAAFLALNDARNWSEFTSALRLFVVTLAAGAGGVRKPGAMSLRSLRLLRTAILMVLAVSLAAYGGQSLTRVWALKKEVASLERQVGVLRADTAKLTAEVDRLRTDPEYIEQIAREKLGLVKPGERVYKLPPATGSR